MQNRWKASVTQSEETNAPAKTEEASSSNSSKKIGIAMGIVGALLVVAGTVPMVFNGDSADLTGDITAQEEMDPLVALLSGGDMGSTASSPSAAPSASSGVASPAVTTPVPKATKAQTPKATPSLKPTPTKAATPTPSSELDKILAEEGESVAVKNTNTGKQDKTGSAFGTASENDTLHGAALSNTSAQPKPSTTVQTGASTSILIGFLLMIVAGMMMFTSASRRIKN